ncbi:carboxypeptidase-like regulatory domain-containing protein [Rufibacter ruber]|uniref:carboxypeptidase-like regulatory domain-containing protein n=1 Tax=Rufibacter ruber TaxID=1783499 RepID=UPI0008317BB7|nr:carboxypeptidase-like regulatory domain-containing protein [Rufibacter ruber]
MTTLYTKPSFLLSRFKPAFLVFGVLLFLFLGGSWNPVCAQGGKKVIQLTGVVTAGDSLLGLPGASVVIPKAGRGTNTNEYGFFSIPVLAGDSVVFSSLGYAKQSIIVPQSFERDSYSVIIEMLEDPNVLPEVRVFPYATFREFTQAVLAMELPDKGIDEQNAMSAQILEQMFRNTPMDGNSNHRNYINLQNQQMLRRGGYNPAANNPLLNPFAWYQVIKSIKNGDFKKKD